jgi:GNAT superfamily N-acetyltransferase
MLGRYVAVAPFVAATGVFRPATEPAAPDAATLEGNEAAAYRSLFRTGARLFGARAFALAGEREAMVFRSPLVPGPGVFNRVLGLGLGVAADEQAIADLLQRVAGPGIAVDIAPGVLSPTVSEALRARGMRRAASSTLVQRPGIGLRAADGVPQAWPAGRGDGPPARQAAANIERRTVAAICARVFGVGPQVQALLEALEPDDGWFHWLAYDAGQPAGAALSFIEGPRCWFGWAATLPEFRRRGVKGALDDARIAHARMAGCRLITSDTATGTRLRPDPSLRSLCRRGFEVAYERPTYLFRGRPAA